MASSFATIGTADLAARVSALADRLVPALKPLAPVAYNYRWSWHPDGAQLFHDINPLRWERSGRNPVRFLNELWPATQAGAERNPALVERIGALAAAVAADLDRPERPRPGIAGPVAFFCAEFGVHSSLPLYSGGLGVLAGDIVKEASDQALPMVGLGLLYGRGYFRQRIDVTGRQQEYWLQTEPHSLPMARVTNDDGSPLRLSVELFGAELDFQVWRVDVGRVPLLLLDTDVPENDPVQRWTTGRLYDASRAIRLAQYGLLGIGGVRVLRALGIEPGVLHLNEGHPALAALELAAESVADGLPLEEALEAARSHGRVHDAHARRGRQRDLSAGGVRAAYEGLAARLGHGRARLPRAVPGRPERRLGATGMTPLALRLSRRRNGVSRLHGEVSRQMWRPMFAGASEVPITHVTNGAHLPTFISRPMRRCSTGTSARAG